MTSGYFRTDALSSSMVQASSGSPFAAQSLSYPFQRNGFYALGLNWLFYHDSANNYFASSSNGVFWNTTLIGGGGETGPRTSAWYDGSVTVHYVCAADLDLWYMKGTLHSTGTISWSPLSTIYSGTGTGTGPSDNPFIMLDSSGNLWIIDDFHNATVSASDHEVMVWRSQAYSNGSWINDVGYPYKIVNGTNSYFCSLLPLSTGVYAVVGKGLDLVGYNWNGSTWNYEAISGTTYLQNPSSYSAVALDDSVYVVWQRYTNYYIDFKERDISGVWLDKSTLVTSGVSYYTSPILSVDARLKRLHVYWVNGNCTYLITYNLTKWSSSTLFSNASFVGASQGIYRADKVNAFYDCTYAQELTFLGASYAINYAGLPLTANLTAETIFNSTSLTASLTVDSTPYTTPFTLDISNTKTLSAPNTVTVDIFTDNFENWTDGSTNTTITANSTMISLQYGNSMMFTAYYEGTYRCGTSTATPSLTWTTLYMRNETHTVNTVPGQMLNETQGTSYNSVNLTVVGSEVAYYGYRVYLTDFQGNTTELSSGTPIGVVGRFDNSSGLLNKSWACPETHVNAYSDALQVDLYMKIGSGTWLKTATFITDALPLKKFTLANWTFSTYTNASLTGGNTVSTVYFGNSTTNTAIYGIEGVAASIYDDMTNRLNTGDFVGFILAPFTNLVGNGFYGLLFFGLSVTLYRRYHSFTPILVLFLIGGGIGGFVGFLIPEIAGGIAWLFMFLGLAGLMWKVFR
jgi:hypothetical protein